MLQHVLRRMGFGASQAELEFYGRLPLIGVVGFLLTYDRAPADVDDKIDDPAYLGVTTRGQFSPDTVINDARQRWLFRMVHTQRPLQEKMALFWHNHFATAYSKVAATFGGEHGDQDDGRQAGQRRRRAARTGAAVPRHGARAFRRAARRGGEGPGDAGVARRPAQRPGAAAGELRPRADGAVHHRRRALHRGGRLRGGAGVHRVEPAPGRRSRRRGDQLLRVRLQRRPARSDRQDVHLRGDARRLADHPGPARGQRRTGRPGPDPRARPAARDRRAASPAGSSRSSSASSRRRARG